MTSVCEGKLFYFLIKEKNNQLAQHAYMTIIYDVFDLLGLMSSHYLKKFDGVNVKLLFSVFALLPL